MTIVDRIILLLTGLAAIYLLVHFGKKQKEAANNSNIYNIISFAVLLVAGLLLIFFGWGALANNFVAIVAGLIPFGLATGLVSKFFPDAEKKYLVLLIIGLVLIAITRYGDMVTAGKIIYPIFHAIAGLTIFALPIYGVKNEKAKSSFIMVTVGGTLIGLGGIALAFLKAGSQLLFFSQEFVLLILAPLLLLMTISFAIGFIKGD